jgi:hypothetical protein
MVRTLTLDIINDKAIQLLYDLEGLQLIRIHNQKSQIENRVDFVKKYKGSMTKQSIQDIDQQINEMRNEWE